MCPDNRYACCEFVTEKLTHCSPWYAPHTPYLQFTTQLIGDAVHEHPSDAHALLVMNSIRAAFKVVFLDACVQLPMQLPIPSVLGSGAHSHRHQCSFSGLAAVHVALHIMCISCAPLTAVQCADFVDALQLTHALVLTTFRCEGSRSSGRNRGWQCHCGVQGQVRMPCTCCKPQQGRASVKAVSSLLWVRIHTGQ